MTSPKAVPFALRTLALTLGLAATTACPVDEEEPDEAGDDAATESEESGGTAGTETDTDTGTESTESTEESESEESTETETEESTETGEPEECGNGIVEDGEACDDGNDVDTDACTNACAEAACGDGIVHEGVEACDDGNDVDDDACSNACQPPSCTDGQLNGDETDVDCGGGCDPCSLGQGCAQPSDCASELCEASVCAVETQFAAGNNHGCALRTNGAVRCWGSAASGGLGYGNTSSVGDDETPASAGDVDVGGLAVQLSTGASRTCALLEDGGLRCWGWGDYGLLGYGNTLSVGEGVTPSWAGDVPVGGPSVYVALGSLHTCAILDGGAVRCWGRNHQGQLGYGHTDELSAEVTPDTFGDVEVGGPVTQLALGSLHGCAILDGGSVRCWGNSSHGQLGYGNQERVGDDETPASVGDVDVGGTVVQLAAGGRHTCALLDDGAVRCWGRGGFGALGYGNGDNIGDDELPASAGDVPVGGSAVQITAGYQHTCAILEGGGVRCWGNGGNGRLGNQSDAVIGDDEPADSNGLVELGGPALQISAGTYHTCAVLADDAIRCWGWGSSGRLGYANTDTIGDDETPLSAGDVPYL